MNTKELTSLRLRNQQIAVHKAGTPAAITAWMGAVQAQDYAGAKWSLGLRLPGSTDTDIEQAIADRTIVRSWSLRGTLHFMAPEDVRLILGLVSARLLKSFGSYYRRLELDQEQFSKSRKIMTAALQGGGQLTRKELMAMLEHKKLSAKGLRANFFMVCAALEGLICLGERRGKEFTYTLLDEWIPAAKKQDERDALSTLTLRYFTSHGPATLQDYAGWAGITLTDARKGLEMVKHELIQEQADNQVYWMKDSSHILPALASTAVYMLPGFDEYLLGYKNRDAVLDTTHLKRVAGTGNGIFSSTIVVKGVVQGIWKRTLKKDGMEINTELFSEQPVAVHKAIVAAIKRYEAFMQLPATILQS